MAGEPSGSEPRGAQRSRAGAAPGARLYGTSAAGHALPATLCLFPRVAEHPFSTTSCTRPGAPRVQRWTRVSFAGSDTALTTGVGDYGTKAKIAPGNYFLWANLRKGKKKKSKQGVEVSRWRRPSGSFHLYWNLWQLDKDGSPRSPKALEPGGQSSHPVQEQKGEKEKLGSVGFADGVNAVEKTICLQNQAEVRVQLEERGLTPELSDCRSQTALQHS